MDWTFKDNSIQSSVHVNISPDDMRATVIIKADIDDEFFNVDTIITMIKEFGVKQGIQKKAIEKIVDGRLFGSEIEIAVGRSAVNGIDGRFDFKFNIDSASNMVVLLDGSLDLFNNNLINEVVKDQVIVEYIPATAGGFGYTVTGKLLMPVKGKDKPALRGVGFKLSEDGKIYTAAIKGRVSLVKGNRLEVSNVFVLNKDLDISVGNIRFDGDVYIKGDVQAGMLVEATENIVIDGHVESAFIKAGKTILIKGGMQGAGTGNIEAGENVIGKFFESTNVMADGNVNANYILNCNIYSKNKVEVFGTKGKIIGGFVKGLKGVETFTLGNSAQVVTNISAGVDDIVMNQYNEIKKNIAKVISEVDILEKGVVEYSKQREQYSVAYNKILQAREVKISERDVLIKKLEEITVALHNTREVKIVARGNVYPQVKISVDMEKVDVSKEVNNVTFKKVDNRVGVFKNS